MGGGGGGGGKRHDSSDKLGEAGDQTRDLRFTRRVAYPIHHGGSSDTFGPRREKTCLWEFANNKGADQPAHPRRLISAFVYCFFESVISYLVASEFSIL